MTPADILGALREAGLPAARQHADGHVCETVALTVRGRSFRAAWYVAVPARNAITVTDHTGTSHYDLTAEGLAAAIGEMKR